MEPISSLFQPSTSNHFYTWSGKKMTFFRRPVMEDFTPTPLSFPALLCPSVSPMPDRLFTDEMSSRLSFSVSLFCRVCEPPPLLFSREGLSSNLWRIWISCWTALSQKGMSLSFDPAETDKEQCLEDILVISSFPFSVQFQSNCPIFLNFVKTKTKNWRDEMGKHIFFSVSICSEFLYVNKRDLSQWFPMNTA